MIAAAAMALALAAPPIDEARAVQIVAKAMESIAGRQRASCLAYEMEEESRASFDIAVREIHDSRCGGEPDVMPVVDRFRVERPSARVLRYDPVTDRWVRCTSNRRKRLTCPAG